MMSILKNVDVMSADQVMSEPDRAIVVATDAKGIGEAFALVLPTIDDDRHQRRAWAGSAVPWRK